MSNLFQEPTSKVPENDSRIVRVGFEEVIPGATKMHRPKVVKRDAMTLVHVKGA
jgi:hypothetical protein